MKTDVNVDLCVDSLKSMAGVIDKGFHFIDDSLAIEMEFGQLLMDEIVKSRPKQIVEIGTGHGYSTSWIMLGTILNGFGKITTWDHEKREPKVYTKLGLSPTREHNKGFEIKDLKHRIDFLFHDSQHSYELITKDMDVLIPKMNKNSQIWIHDVRDALAKRLSEYFKDKGWNFRSIEESWGMGIATNA